jgi:hypothetical protein
VPTIEPWGQWRDERSDEPAESAEQVDPVSFRVAVDLLAQQFIAQARRSTSTAPAPEESP